VTNKDKLVKTYNFGEPRFRTDRKWTLFTLLLSKETEHLRNLSQIFDTKLGIIHIVAIFMLTLVNYNEGDSDM